MAILVQNAGLTWWEKLFGQELVSEFAPPLIEVGDIITDRANGAEWHVEAIYPQAPYIALPAEFLGYTLDEDWAYLWRVNDVYGATLSEYVPVQYIVDLIERG